MKAFRSAIATEDLSTQTSAAITMFVCANCARPGQALTSAGRPRPAVPNFSWPLPVREVLLPCMGRLQPEHVLRAFESGADIVCGVACEQDNCHYVEGSKRCARRVDYIRTILDEVGLGGERLMLFSLPGTAAEDMALSAGRPASTCDSEALETRVAGIRDQVMQALYLSPLREAPAAETTGDFYQEDTSDDDSAEYACPDASLQPAGYHG